MRLEIDHIFILASAGAPEGDRLTACGFPEGPPNTHPGQGTACRRFWFQSAYLELLWVQSSLEAQSELVRPTYLWERWNHRIDTACPFGFIVRPPAGAEGEPPFSSWEYRPPYLPPSLSLAVGSNAQCLIEPMVFFLAGHRRQPLVPAGGLRAVSRVTCVLPSAANPSPELRSIITSGLVRFEPGASYLLDLGIDGEIQGDQADLRPALPLIFRW